MTKRAKRLLIGIPLVLVGLVVVVLVIALLNINRVVKIAVEKALPPMAGVAKDKVKLEKVDISLFSGKGTLTGFDLGNPEGYKMEHAIQFQTVSVDLDIRSLLSDTIIINDITIDSPTITYEMGIPHSNIGTILKNMQEFAGPPAEKKPEAEKKPGKKMIIRHLLIKSPKLVGSIQGLGQGAGIPLPSIEMNDIGKETGGTSPAQVAAQVMEKITGVVTDAIDVLKKAPQAALKAGKDALKSGTDGVKGAVESINPFK